MNYLKNPYKLLLIDGMGALLSIGILVTIIRNHLSFFGLTDDTFKVLLIIGGFLAALSLTIALIKPRKVKNVLAIAAFGNSVYLLAVLKDAFLEGQKAQPLAMVFFGVEALIVISLIVVEFRLYRQLNLSAHE